MTAKYRIVEFLGSSGKLYYEVQRRHSIWLYPWWLPVGIHWDQEQARADVLQRIEAEKHKPRVIFQL